MICLCKNNIEYFIVVPKKSIIIDDTNKKDKRYRFFSRNLKFVKKDFKTMYHVQLIHFSF